MSGSSGKIERQMRVAELLKQGDMNVETMLQTLNDEGYEMSESTFHRDRREINEIWIQRTLETTETRIARALKKLDEFQRDAAEAGDHKARRALLRDELEMLQLVGSAAGRKAAPDAIKKLEHDPGTVEVCGGGDCDHSEHTFIPPPPRKEVTDGMQGDS